MDSDTEDTLNTCNAAPVSEALLQRLMGTAKAAQEQSQLDLRVEQVLKKMQAAPIRPALQTKLEQHLPYPRKKHLSLEGLYLYASPYKTLLTRVAAICLFVCIGSLASITAISASHKNPSVAQDTNLLAATNERQIIEHFAPIGYTKRDIVALQAEDNISWNNEQAYQNCKVKYNDKLVVDLDDDTSIIISVPYEGNITVPVDSI